MNMQDLTEIRITVHLDDGVGGEEEFRTILTPAHQEDGSVKFILGEAERRHIEHAMTWSTANQLCLRLTGVGLLLSETLLNQDAIYREEE